MRLSIITSFATLCVVAKVTAFVNFLPSSLPIDNLGLGSGLVNDPGTANILYNVQDPTIRNYQTSPQGISDGLELISSEIGMQRCIFLQPWYYVCAAGAPICPPWMFGGPVVGTVAAASNLGNLLAQLFFGLSTLLKKAQRPVDPNFSVDFHVIKKVGYANFQSLMEACETVKYFIASVNDTIEYCVNRFNQGLEYELYREKAFYSKFLRDLQDIQNFKFDLLWEEYVSQLIDVNWIGRDVIICLEYEFSRNVHNLGARLPTDFQKGVVALAEIPLLAPLFALLYVLFVKAFDDLGIALLGWSRGWNKVVPNVKAVSNDTYFNSNQQGTQVFEDDMKLYYGNMYDNPQGEYDRDAFKRG